MAAEGFDLATVLSTPDDWAFDHHSILLECVKKYQDRYGFALPSDA